MSKEIEIECPECGNVMELGEITDTRYKVVAKEKGSGVQLSYGEITHESPLHASFVCENEECPMEATEEELKELAREQLSQ